MADTVTLALQGDPTLEGLSRALSGMVDLLAGLGAHVARGEQITWKIEDLFRSSAGCTARGESTNTDAVQRVAEAYVDVGYRLQRNEVIPYGRSVSDALERLIQVIDDVTTTEIRFETADDDVTIGRGPLPGDRVAVLDWPPTWGGVEGRVQTLSSRGSLRFVVFDALYDKPVSCYLQPDQQGLVRDVWDRFVLVRGMVKRESGTGRPTAVRQITEITPIAEYAQDALTRARGLWDLAGKRPEEVIRELRNVE